MLLVLVVEISVTDESLPRPQAAPCFMPQSPIIWEIQIISLWRSPFYRYLSSCPFCLPLIMTSCLKFVSYYCRGWKSVLQSCDICLIKEHWLLRDSLGLLNISDDLLVSHTNLTVTVWNKISTFQNTAIGTAALLSQDGIFQLNLSKNLLISDTKSVLPQALKQQKNIKIWS